MPPPKTIIITGASSGIGAATALQLAKEKHNLILAARRLEKLDGVAKKCRDLGANPLTLRCDVSNRHEVDALVSTTLEKLPRLDVMLANAGYGFLAKIHETTDQQFDDIVATNVKGTLYCMQAAAQVMLKQEPLPHRKRAARGHIIAVSSGAARRGLPLYGVYSMTKAAQLSLAEAMRVELKPQGIYVSTVHPLTTATEFFDVASSKSRLRSTGLGHAQPAEIVARKIARLIAHPKPELWPVFASRWGLAFAALFPSIVDYAMARTIYRRTR
ncbi:MAG TPA: SDR family oxidoreductase [Phycisphaerae bacterium]|nr:SDR family oxidoreductase [Phycisphaerae bacterium]